MAKLTLNTLVGGLASLSKLNANFSALVTALQTQVLYRDNPTGEPNQMETELDMNGQSIYNAATIETGALKVGGQWVTNPGTSIFVVLTSAPYNADNTGATDASAILEQAMDDVEAAGGGVVYCPAGDYKFTTTPNTHPRVIVKGESTVGYFGATAVGTRFVRDAALSNMFNHVGNLCLFSDIEFEGNGGDAAASRTTVFNRPNSGGGSGLWLDRVTATNFWNVCYNASSFGGVNVQQCTFGDCKIAIFNPSDSVLTGNLFTRMTTAGVWINTGAVRITDNMFEFHHNNSNASNPIVIQTNANEIIIHGNRFDRNAGSSVWCSGGRDISIMDNDFMRCAWGANLFKYQRASIYASGTKRIKVVGNTCYAASSNPSLIRGAVSPIMFFQHTNCTGVVEEGNSYGNLGKIYLKTGATNEHSVAPVWTLSGSGSGEYYLTDNVDADGNTYIPEPDALFVDGVALTAGTAGALTAQTWDWADNETPPLGFNTVYARITGDGTPAYQEVYAYYDYAPVPTRLSAAFVTASTDVRDGTYKDLAVSFAAARAAYAAGATAVTNGAKLVVTVPKGHSLVVGDWVYLSNAVTVAITTRAYQIADIVDAGANDDIEITSSAGAASGTIDLATAGKFTKTLKTSNVCVDGWIMPITVRIGVRQSTSAAYSVGNYPIIIRRSSGVVSKVQATPTIISSASLDVDWNGDVDTATDLVVTATVVYTGQEIILTIWNVSDKYCDIYAGVLHD